MTKMVLLKTLVLLGVLVACNPTQKSVLKPDPIENGLPGTIIKSLEVAQTHVIPPEGKTWTGDKLAKYNLHLVGNRDALVLVEFDPSQTVSKPMLEVSVNGQRLGQVALNAPDALPKTEANGPAYSSTTF
jgi:hypothetical protein